LIFLWLALIPSDQLLERRDPRLVRLDQVDRLGVVVKRNSRRI
jgi:hypothetical protein